MTESYYKALIQSLEASKPSTSDTCYSVRLTQWKTTAKMLGMELSAVDRDFPIQMYLNYLGLIPKRV